MRPKAVIFIGNGFTISLSDFLGIMDWHNPSKLFPPPLWLQEESTQTHDNKYALWSRERYPDLWDLWQDALNKQIVGDDNSFNKFCQLVLNKGRAFDTPDDPDKPNFIAYQTRNSGYQLRRYLWYFFYLFQKKFTKHLLKDSITSPETAEYEAELKLQLFKKTAKWDLIRTLKSLGKDWDLTIVTYNYDSYIENILSSHGCELVQLNADEEIDLSELPANCIRVFHIHGRLATHTPSNVNNKVPINDSIISENNNVLLHQFSRDFKQGRYYFPPRLPCPDFPDLVPPGHSEDHLLARFSYYHENITKLISQADVVGAIGFSAAPPDADEFKSYFKKFKPNLKTFSIGLECFLPKADSTKILKSVSLNHESFDISEMNKFYSWSKITFNEYHSNNIVKDINDLREFEELMLVFRNRIASGNYESIEDLEQIEFNRQHIRPELVEYSKFYAIAESLRLQGNGGQALKYYQNCLLILDNANTSRNNHSWLHISIHITTSYILLTDFENAKKILKEISNYVDRQNDLLIYAEFHSALGEVELFNKNNEKAIESLIKSQDAYKELVEFDNAALILMKLSTCYFNNRDLDSCFKSLDEAGELYQLNENEKGLGMVLSTQAQFFGFIRNGFEESVSCSRIAIEKLNPYKNELAMAKLILSQTLMNNEKIEDAKKELSSCIKICKQYQLTNILNHALDLLRGIVDH